MQKLHGNDIKNYLDDIYKNTLLPALGSPVYTDWTPDYFSSDQLVFGKDPIETRAFLTSLYYISNLYSDFKKHGDEILLNPEAFDYLQRIINFTKEKHLKIDVYITPQHGTHWATAERFGLGEYVDRWLTEVAKITPYWDFSGRVDFSRNVNKYFAGDDRHITYEAGEIVLISILKNKIEPENGIRYVTNQTVNQLIQYRHQAEAKWLQQNKYLANIFSNPKFKQLRNLHGDIQRSIVHYNPTYRQYKIFEFMGNYFAIPEKYANYDLGKFIFAEYPDTIQGDSLKSVLSQIPNQHRC